MDINIVKTNNELVEPTQQVLNRTTAPNENPNAGRGGSTSDGSGRGNTSGRTPSSDTPQDSGVVISTNDRVPVDFPDGNPNTDDTDDTPKSPRGGSEENPKDPYNPDIPPFDWDEINKRLGEIWNSLLGGTQGLGNMPNMDAIGSTILGFIQNLANAMKAGNLNLDNVQRTNLASQIYNIASGYMQMQLQQYYARENWLFENSYNSPINQIGRLIEAGVNPAFYYSASSKDTAGEIGGVEQSQAQLQGVDGMTDTQRKYQKVSNALSMLGTLGNVGVDMGNLTNLTSQARLASITGEDIQNTFTGRNSQTFANAAYLTALGNKETVTLPYLKEQMRTTSLLNEATIENYAITANQRWKEIEESMRQADNQINTSRWIAELRSKTDKDIADMTSSRSLAGVKFSSQMAFQGTKYSADRNFEASKYATDEQVKLSRWCKNMDRRMGLELKAMDNLYDDVFFTQYIDETTGERTHDLVSLGLGVTDASDVKFGHDGTATVGGHRIRRDEIKSHVFNYDRMRYANQTILNLVRYNDENYVPSSTMFHYAKEYDNVFNRAFFNWAIPKMSAAYGSYLTDQFMNTATVTDKAGNMQGTFTNMGAGGLTTGWHQ